MLKLLVLFGGQSSEHEISCLSAYNVLENINQNKYIVSKIGIDLKGTWYLYSGDNKYIKNNTWLNNKKYIKEITNIIGFIKKFDVVFPVLHGKYGEDGIIQSLLEYAKVKYVGCNNSTSVLCIDKSLSKIMASNINIPIVPYQILYKEKKLDKKSLSYPLIVKPCSEGSSFGVTKVHNEKELNKAINLAYKYDKKILIENFIEAIEIECAVLGNNPYIISDIGQIIPDNEFYDYESKYESNNSKIIIPANVLNKDMIQNYTLRISEALHVRGLARVDFFIDKNNKEIYFNEINTMPGFTDISMYPKLIEHYGINYSELIDKLIMLALE